MMKLLKSAGCLLPADGGNVKEQTMIVEEQGIGFRTGVRFPSGPLKALDKMLFCPVLFCAFISVV